MNLVNCVLELEFLILLCNNGCYVRRLLFLFKVTYFPFSFQKTLIVIESMFHSGISNSQDLFASKFTSRFEMLRSSHQKAVRAKSTKVRFFQSYQDWMFLFLLSLT